MNNKHLTEEEIAIAAEAMLNDNYDSLPAHTQYHLQACEQCSNEVIAVCSIIDGENFSTDKKAITLIPKRKSVSTLKYILAGAASIALLVSLFFVLKNDGNSTNKITRNDDSIMTQPSNKLDSIKQQIIEKQHDQILKKDNILAYNQNPELEKVYQRFNSTNMRSDELEIVTYGILKNTGSDTTHLRWESNAETFIIQIIDARGKIIEESKNSNGSIKIKLKHGLFYWKLLDLKFNILYCGKIIVE